MISHSDIVDYILTISDSYSMMWVDISDLPTLGSLLDDTKMYMTPHVNTSPVLLTKKNLIHVLYNIYNVAVGTVQKTLYPIYIININPN